MLYSPGWDLRYGQGRCNCSSPCAGRCVKTASCPPPCPPDVRELAGKYPYRRHFECLDYDSLGDLLDWAENYRLYDVGESRRGGASGSDMSVILAALHFHSLGELHEQLSSSYLGVMGDKQLSHWQGAKSDTKNTGWSSTVWGQQYLDLMNYPQQFFTGGVL